MKSLIYISGPSCAGKSTLADQILAAHHKFSYVSGNEYWLAAECSDFGERVMRTNQGILQALHGRGEPHLLLDWVPHAGAFRTALAEACTADERRLVHIALTATDRVLQDRKFERDGSRDTSCHSTLTLAGVPDCLVIDTTLLSPAQVFSQANRFLLTQQCDGCTVVGS